eukprot:95220-Prorocentrum_minimum.AAC.1
MHQKPTDTPDTLEEPPSGFPSPPPPPPRGYGLDYPQPSPSGNTAAYDPTRADSGVPNQRNASVMQHGLQCGATHALSFEPPLLLERGGCDEGAWQKAWGAGGIDERYMGTYGTAYRDPHGMYP